MNASARRIVPARVRAAIHVLRGRPLGYRLERLSYKTAQPNTYILQCEFEGGWFSPSAGGANGEDLVRWTVPGK